MCELPIVHYLCTALESGYYRIDDCREWADKVILNHKVEDIAIWVFDVAFATSEQQFYAAVWEQKSQEVFYDSTWYCNADVIAGYYYLLYCENKMTVVELIDRLREEDDNACGGNLYDNTIFHDTIFSIKYDTYTDEKQKEKIYQKSFENIKELLFSMSLIATQQQNRLKLYCESI